jgi:hypothetical protein
MTVTREAFRDALSGVPGVTGETTRPSTPAAGQAWPEWRSSRWLNRCVVETAWYVYVVLPGDPRGAIDAGDPLVEPIGLALVGLELRVDQVEPWRIPLGNDAASSAPALRYSCTD